MKTENTIQTKLDRREIECTLTHFVVRSFGYWGKGTTLKEAKANCIRAGGRTAKTEKTTAHWGTPDIEVLSDGAVTASFMVYLGEV